MSFKLQKIFEPLILGESPHWDERVQALYFVIVDVYGHSIHKYVPSTGTHTKTTLDGRVGFIVPLKSSTTQFVVGVEHKFQIVEWDGQDGTSAAVVRGLAEVDGGKRTRINDGKCDPRGRLYAGTMGYKDPYFNVELNTGSLFRFDGAKIATLATGIDISNGLAWDLKRRAFYYTDSLEYNIRRYDYDVETGDISNLKYIFDFKKNGIEGIPDGTTIDADGNLWVAVFQGSCVLKIDPTTGKMLQKLPIPIGQVTSVTFGGENYETLFVTSGGLQHVGEEKPPCGAIYTVTGLGVRGLPSVHFKI